MWHLVIIIFIIFLSLIITNENMEIGSFDNGQLEGWSWSNLWPWSHQKLHQYDNLNYSSKSIGSPGTYNIYKHWKNREDHWKEEYSKVNVDVDMNKVKGISSGTLESTETNDRSIDPEYYNDPLAYCKKNPNKYPCPNHWLKDSAAFNDQLHQVSHPTGNMLITNLTSKMSSPLMTNHINDNYHTRLIDIEREDHGLCGNF